MSRTAVPRVLGDADSLPPSQGGAGIRAIAPPPVFGPLGTSLGDRSLGGSIVTGFAARRAVVKAILAEANVDLALAKAAVFFAAAFVFSSFALHTRVFLAGTSA